MSESGSKEKVIYYPPSISQEWVSNPKKHTVQKTKELGLFEDLAMIGRYFGMFQSCQIEEVRRGCEVNSKSLTEIIEIVAGYEISESVVIKGVQSLPLATLLRTRKVVRVHHANNTIQFIPLSNKDIELIHKYRPLTFKQTSSVKPATGF